tara:strand:- start:311 stop:640 length:330 start_codon:yes stop_codon:yes gene_type:complete
MIYNIPHLNEETLGPRFDTFLKDKKKPWMYKLLIIVGPPKPHCFRTWNLKNETRYDLMTHRDEYAKVYADIKVFFRDTEWCTHQGMAFKVLQKHIREDMQPKRWHSSPL